MRTNHEASAASPIWRAWRALRWIAKGRREFVTRITVLSLLDRNTTEKNVYPKDLAMRLANYRYLHDESRNFRACAEIHNLGVIGLMASLVGAILMTAASIASHGKLGIPWPLLVITAMGSLTAILGGRYFGRAQGDQRDGDK